MSNKKPTSDNLITLRQNQSPLKKDKEVWKNVGAARISPNVNNIKDKSVKCLMTYDDYKK